MIRVELKLTRQSGADLKIKIWESVFVKCSESFLPNQRCPSWFHAAEKISDIQSLSQKNDLPDAIVWLKFDLIKKS